MKVSVRDFFSKCKQIQRKMRICSHLLEKSLKENFIFLCTAAAVMCRRQPMESELRFCSGSNPARSVSEVCDGGFTSSWKYD